MKCKFFVFAGFVCLLLAASAYGQHKRSASIPFDFVVNDHSLPAGKYDFQFDASHSSVVITNLNTKEHTVVLTHALDMRDVQSKPADGDLLFLRDANQYVLHRIGEGNKAYEVLHDRQIAELN